MVRELSGYQEEMDSQLEQSQSWIDKLGSIQTHV